MVALRVVFSNITCGVFCHSCFCKGVWRCLRIDVGDLNTPLLFCRAGIVVVKRLRGRKKENRDMEMFSVIKLVLEIIVPSIAIYDWVTNKLEQKRRREAVANDSHLQEIGGDEIVDDEVAPTEVSSRKKDMTLYFLNNSNEKYGKARLVLAVIKSYVESNPGVTYKQLQDAFPPSLRGLKRQDSFWGCFSLRTDAERLFSDTGTKRHFLKDNEIIRLANGDEVAVSSQWGIGNIKDFIARAKEIGFHIK